MWIWFGLAVMALIGELLTGTFYLLLIAVGLAAGGIAAQFSLALQWQLLTFGVVSLASLTALRKMRVLKKRETDWRRNVNVNMDIGQMVEVADWAPNGTTQVQHRGAAWQADLAEGEAPQTGAHVIVAMHGNRLVLSKHSE